MQRIRFIRDAAHYADVNSSETLTFLFSGSDPSQVAADTGARCSSVMLVGRHFNKHKNKNKQFATRVFVL